MNGASAAARDKGSSKFSVYQNPALSAALTANSLRPSNCTFICIFSASAASAYAFLRLFLRENGIVNYEKVKSFSPETTYFVARTIQFTLGLVFIGSLLASAKAISLRRARNVVGAQHKSSPKDTKCQTFTNRQLGLMGMKPKAEEAISELSKKPPKSKLLASSPSSILVPLHQPIPISSRASRTSTDKTNTSGGSKVHPFSTPSKSPSSASSLFLVPTGSSQLSSTQTSPGLEQLISTPWSNKRGSASKEIMTEDKLEQFLEDVGERITESAGKLATPPPTINGFSVSSPNTLSSSANTSGTTRSTPLRPVRMSPSSQKFTTPPKKAEGDFPPPMSMEDFIEAFEHLGIHRQIEQWRDCLRQWFSSYLLNPLLQKIESSHTQVMVTAAKLGISITISQVGNDAATTGTPVTTSAIDRTKEWQPAFTLDEEGLLHQLFATLAQALDASSATWQQSPQQNSLVPIIQECVDAITEHQRLHALMKGELIKGILPQSSVRADYTIQRVRELSEGSCVKNFEYLGSGEVYDKISKKWSPDLPSDSHLLLYLFWAFLEHPKWMLHMDPVSYTGAQSSKNPLFLGVLPPKERFPEKCIAVMSSVPSALHPGLSVMVVGRQCPPTIALYWDKKLQFSLQGRTALWDSILLMCHQIKIRYGGIIRGMHLGSSALSILPVLESNGED